MRKPGSPLPQAIRRLTEKLQSTEHRTCRGIFCRKEHNKGPLPDYLDPIKYVQYKELHRSDCIITVSRPDNCVMIQKDIYVVKNIISQHGTTKLICQKFYVKVDFYSYPLKSSWLNIWSVRRLGSDLLLFQPAQVVCKMLLLPHSGHYVVVPLL